MKAWVLVYVDEINLSSGPQSVSDHHEIVAVRETLGELQSLEEVKDVNFKLVEDERWVGEVSYDGEVEEGQFYLAFPVG